MKPYYEDSAVTIYHGDNREIGMKSISEYKADLLLTDPPYGIFKNTGGAGLMFGKPTIYSEDDTAATWDRRPESETLLGWISGAEQWVIWGGNYFADILGACKGVLVWNKLTGNNSYADGEIAFSNVAGTTRIFTHQWCGAFKDSERGQRAMHPTQKPLELMRWCIGLANSPKLIVDPFMGSGTTLRAAKDLGARAIGIDISEKYCEIAANRMAQEVLVFA